LNVTPRLIALAVSTVFFAVGYALEDYVRDPITAVLSSFGVPDWMQFLLSLAPVALLGVAVHRAMHTTDHLFNSRFHHASAHLESLGKEAKQAKIISDIDAALVNGPRDSLMLASAAAFRRTNGSALHLVWKSGTWAENRTELWPDISSQLFENLKKSNNSAIRIPAPEDDDAPGDITAPAVVVPVVFEGELQAVAMYSPHASGADLDDLELGMLQKFAGDIAIAYEKLGKRLIEQELLEFRRHAVRQQDV
jgi:hypothetical protein